VQLINHGQSSSLKASFEIELGPLDFNRYDTHYSILDYVLDTTHLSLNKIFQFCLGYVMNIFWDKYTLPTCGLACFHVAYL
jgi:hypothetical protein